MPTVSLIVPVYNAEAYLARGVAALCAQTFSDIEILLVNDGSTDGSGALCDAAAAQDSRVRVIHKQNGGAGSARNAGIDAARGKYLMFPDADDECLPEMTATLVEAAEQSGADVTLCGYCAVEDGKEETVALTPARTVTGRAAVHEFAARYFPLGIVGYPWNKIYRAEFIREHGLRYPDMRRFQDGVFNLGVFDCAESVCVLPQVLYRYKVNDLAGIFLKFPANMPTLLRQITDAYYDRLAVWQLSGDCYEQQIRAFYQNGVVGCVDCMYSPAWGFTAADRRAFLRRMAADETLARCAVSEEGLSRYAALVIRLLKKERFSVLLVVVRVKLMLKKSFHRLFRLMKG